jgi:hypothetical protein
MSYKMSFLDAERRVKDGQVYAMKDYRFRVSNEESAVIVAVGITQQFHDLPEALGSKKLSLEELTEAAATWLRSRLDKGECDPFNRPGDRMIDVPPVIMDYWIEKRSIPGSV